ncbi:hypothetical protein CR969_02995 [Candidatus Saccharibacteria bacterium]|nr:MAG: hypothetical protein CR969_02995 [Candidatus Saccharibacteria bacterium]
MYPNDSNSPQPTGIDYLNQISAPPPAKGFDKKTKLIIAGLGLACIMGLGLIFMMASQGNNGPSNLKMVARLQQLKNISEEFNPKLRDSQLQTANSSLIAVLITANTAVVEPAADTGIDIKKQAKELKSLSADPQLVEKLNDAELNANLDAAYSHEMNVRLIDTISMMNKLLKKNRSQQMKQFLGKTISDLTNVQKQFDKVIKADQPAETS